MVIFEVLQRIPRRTRLLLFFALVLVGTTLTLGAQTANASAPSLLLAPSPGLSPADVMNAATKDPSLGNAIDNWLAFGRWSSASSVPTAATKIADLGTGGMLTNSIQTIASLIMGVALFLLGLVGKLLAFAFGIPFISKTTFLADGIFAKAGGSFFSAESGSWAYFIIPAILVILALTALSFLQSQRLGRGIQSSRALSVTTVGIVALLFVMVMQSGKNHSETLNGRSGSAVATMNPTADSNVTSDRPQDWAIGSMGWVVIQAKSIVNLASDHFSHFGDTLAESARAAGYSGASGTGQCADMVAGMHATFKKTKAYSENATAAGLLLAYDDFMVNTYYKAWALSQGGDTTSGNASWCQKAETLASKSVGNRLLVARQAGLLPEVAGTGSIGLGKNEAVMTSHGWTPVGSGNPTTDNRIVLASGAWATDAGGASNAYYAASALLGPSYTKADGSANKDGAAVANGFWAACISSGPGKATVLNPEWAKVQASGSEDLLGDDANVCHDVLADPDGFASDPATKNFQYVKDSGLFGTGWFADDMASKFTKAGADDSGATKALNYFRASNGLDGFTSLGYAIMAGATCWFVVRYLAGLLVGGLFAQALGSVLLLLLSGGLFLALIPRVRAYVKEVITMIGQSMAVVFGMSVLFSVLFVIMAILQTLLGAFTFDNAFFQMLAYLIAMFLSFNAIRLLVERFTRLNLSSFKGQIQAGLAAGSPAMQRLGFDTLSPLEFVQKPDEHRTSSPLIRHDKNTGSDKKTADRATDADLMGDRKAAVRAQRLDKVGKALGAVKVAGEAATATGIGAEIGAPVALAAKAGEKWVGHAQKLNDALPAKGGEVRSKNDGILDKARWSDHARSAGAWTHDLLFSDPSLRRVARDGVPTSSSPDGLLSPKHQAQLDASRFHAVASAHNHGVQHADEKAYLENDGSLRSVHTREPIGHYESDTGVLRFTSPSSEASTQIVTQDGKVIRSHGPDWNARQGSTMPDLSETHRLIEELAGVVPGILSRLGDENIPLIDSAQALTEATNRFPGLLPATEAGNTHVDPESVMRRLESMREDAAMAREHIGSGNEVMDMASVAWSMNREAGLFIGNQIAQNGPDYTAYEPLRPEWRETIHDEEMTHVLSALLSFGRRNQRTNEALYESVLASQLNNEAFLDSMFNGHPVGVLGR